MYLMYVDDSGDCGLPSDGSPSALFCLSGIVVHEMRWKETLDDLSAFRRGLYQKYKVNIEDELHTAEMINKPSRLPASLKRLRKHERLAIIRHFADAIAKLSDVNIVNVVVDKRTTKAASKDEVFRWAWYAMFQRFENTIRYQNFPGPKNADDRGLVFPDNTDGQKLRQFLLAMRQRNPLKVRHSTGAYVIEDKPIRVIVEDPVLRDSRESYFIQAADCAAFLLKQHVLPSSYMKRHGGNAYLKRLDPVLCTRASDKDPTGRGIVWL